MRLDCKLGDAVVSVFVLLSLGLGLTTPACAAKKTDDQDIATVLQSSHRFQYVWDVLRKSGHLEQVLQTKGPFTVFATKDSAFEKLGLSSWVTIWSDQRRLRQIMSYNIVRGAFDQNALASKHELPTIEGHALRLDVRHNKIFIGKARVGKVIKCANGFIYTIDRLLAPPQATAGTEAVQ